MPKIGKGLLFHYVGLIFNIPQSSAPILKAINNVPSGIIAIKLTIE
jgi:hypothetical protein